MGKNIGIKLCDYLKGQLGEQYSGLRGKINFSFTYGKEEKKLKEKMNRNVQECDKENKVCRCSLYEIQDSRLDDENRVYGCWTFQGEVPNEAREAWGYLGDLLVRTLSDKFKDLLYLEEAEKEIGTESPKEDDPRKQKAEVRHFVGDLLDEKWLMDCYTKEVLQECRFPERKLLAHISAQLYEKRPLKAKLYFSDKPLKEVALEIDKTKKEKKERAVSYIKLETGGEDIVSKMPEYELNMDNLRTIRKLLEMPGERYGFLAVRDGDKYRMEGLIHNDVIEEKSYIQFEGYMRWCAVSKGNEVLQYKDGSYNVPKTTQDNDKEGWKGDIENLKNQEAFKNFSCDMETIKDVIEILIKSSQHGTSIIFMDDALLEEEVKRLWEFKRAYRVEEFFMIHSVEAVKGIAGIDGALIADFKGYCHAAGAILDGEMISAGRSDRGARYNSIANYVSWVLKKWEKEKGEKYFCFAAIISEDEMVNLIFPKRDGS